MTDVSEERSASIISAMMMEAVCSSETSVNFNLTTQLYILEDSKLHICCRENQKSYMASGLQCKLQAFFFFADDNNERKSQHVLNELENIDDECDALGIAFVKIDNRDEAKEYGIEKLPSLMYFEKGIPTIYDGLY
jgi:hypothetical protein